MAVVGARQGHLYDHHGDRVIAMNNGDVVAVRPIIEGWLGETRIVEIEELEPLPMIYYCGETPS